MSEFASGLSGGHATLAWRVTREGVSKQSKQHIPALVFSIQRTVGAGPKPPKRPPIAALIGWGGRTLQHVWVAMSGA
jgi:hypothetical protein